MILHPINKKMIVQTSIELQPYINYVSASSDCNTKYLDRLEIDSAGVYGDIKANTIKVRRPGDGVTDRFYDINDKFIDLPGNCLEILAQAKDQLSNFIRVQNQIIDNIEDGALPNIISQDLIDIGSDFAKASLERFKRLSIADSFGIKINSFDQSFNVDRIEKKYIIDNSAFLKKKSVKNLYNFYRENIKCNNYYDLNWGFKNYNSLNFFNIYDDFNPNFSNNITHKNCLIYPNLYHNQKSSYDFKSNEYTFSFYINPKRTVESSLQYNPGCVINIPGVISVYVVKGSSKNENNESDKFRIFCELGNDTYSLIENNFQNFDISDFNKQISNFCFLSEDNLLNLNNWHNVTISYKANDITNNKSDISLYIDGNLLSQYDFNDKIQNLNESSVITIGNKIPLNANEISNFVLYCFSKDNTDLDDNEGPYVNKHILYGSDIDSVLNTGSDEDVNYYFRNTLKQENTDYIDQDTSLALNAELCDVRIYTEFVGKDKAKLIAEKSVEDIQKEIDDFSLSFYLPVYFKSQNVRKKGLVNLSAPYEKVFISQDGGDFISVDEYLQGTYEVFDEDQSNWPDSEDDFRVKIENISYNFPINPFFLNFTGGTDVSVEHFLREFVKNTQPNITIGGSFKDDRYQDCFLTKPSVVLEDKVFNDLSKKGNTPYRLYESIMRNLSEKDLTSMDIDYQSNNISYRNYMILPNDNGLQRQYYNEKVFMYDSSDYLDIHKNNLNYVDFSFVSMENIDKKHSLNNTISKESNLLILENFIDGDLKSEIRDLTDRAIYAFDNVVLRDIFSQSFAPFFYESADKLKNISLSNFYNLENSVYINDQDFPTINKNSVFKNNGDLNTPQYIYLESNTGFYKTLSNPAQRSYYSSHDNAISNKEVYDFKLIEENSQIAYKKMLMPLEQIDSDFNENSSTIFCISTQLFNKKIKRETLEIKDADLSISSGLSLTFKDSQLGSLYRCDSLTKHAKWNTVGNVLYNDGFATIIHPSMFNFGQTNFRVKSQSHTDLNVFELNIPANSGETNKSNNLSYIEGLKLDQSAFNSDEDFVYITDIDLHDENLNVVASAKLAQPFAKKDSDNVLFRIKMDF